MFSLHCFYGIRRSRSHAILASYHLIRPISSNFTLSYRRVPMQSLRYSSISIYPTPRFILSLGHEPFSGISESAEKARFPDPDLRPKRISKRDSQPASACHFPRMTNCRCFTAGGLALPLRACKFISIAAALAAGKCVVVCGLPLGEMLLLFLKLF